MANNTEEFRNGDLRLLGSKIDNLAREVEAAKIERKGFHDEITKIVGQQSTQIALLEQSNRHICRDVDLRKEECEALSERMNKQDSINKIVGGFTAALYAIAAYLGLRA